MPRERKKRFSPKVRTGCMSCKARRIKCPEEKPECFSCLKSGILCIYAPPEARVLQLQPELPRGQGFFHVFETETKLTPQEIDSESTQPEATVEVGTAVNVHQALRCNQPTDIPFNDPSERAVFGFYVTRTGPLLHEFERGGDFFQNVVPRLAWQSETVRETVLALVNLDQRRLSTMWRSSSDMIKDANRHYLKAIQRIQGGHTSRLETLVAAMVAWLVETFRFNHKAARVHLQGARTLVEELEYEALESRNQSQYDFVRNVLRRSLVTNEGYQIGFEGSQPLTGNDSQLEEPTHHEGFKALRHQIDLYLTRHHEVKPTQTELREYIKACRRSFSTYKTFERRPVMAEKALELLFLLATTLVPQDKKWTARYGKRSQVSGFVLKRVVIILRSRADLSKEDSELLEETVEIVLKHLFCLFNEQEEWVQWRDTIVSVAQEKWDVFKRTRVLDSLGIDRTTFPPPPVIELPKTELADGST